MATPRHGSLNLFSENLLTTHISLLSLSSACQIVHHLHVQLKTIRPVPSPVCESQNLISRRSWKGVSCWAPFTAALFGAQVWAHNFLSPLQAEQSSWWRTENPPRGSLLSIGLRIHFTFFSSRPPSSTHTSCRSIMQRRSDAGASLRAVLVM